MERWSFVIITNSRDVGPLLYILLGLRFWYLKTWQLRVPLNLKTSTLNRLKISIS